MVYDNPSLRESHGYLADKESVRCEWADAWTTMNGFRKGDSLLTSQYLIETAGEPRLTFEGKDVVRGIVRNAMQALIAHLKGSGYLGRVGFDERSHGEIA